MSDFKMKYETEVIPKLKELFNYKNVMQIPRLYKIVVNMGLGEAIHNIKILDSASAEMGAITGQKPIIRRAKKSIAAFKLREGMPIGCKVTLRGKKMTDFFTRLVNIALPRVRDFKGVSGNSMDGHGNYSMGIKEQIIFPEVDYDAIDKIKGMNVTIVTTAKADKEGKALLKLLGMPFRN